jgi:hypothetical protein
MRYEIKLRYIYGYDAYRWAIVRLADNEIILHSDRRRGLENMLALVKRLEEDEPSRQPLTQADLDGRPVGFEPQGSVRRLLWKAGKDNLRAA